MLWSFSGVYVAKLPMMGAVSARLTAQATCLRHHLDAFPSRPVMKPAPLASSSAINASYRHFLPGSTVLPPP
jgi:hypothetical protein